MREFTFGRGRHIKRTEAKQSPVTQYKAGITNRLKRRKITLPCGCKLVVMEPKRNG